MAHLDAYLGKVPSFGSEGGPGFSTRVVPLKNKRTRRNANWAQPKWLFTLIFNNNTPSMYESVLDLLLVCRGRLNFFRVRNDLFYKAQAWKFGYGDGSTAEFQLGRLVEIGGESFLQQIHALSLDSAAPTPQFFVDGVAAPATVNPRTGRVLFDTPPADEGELTWSGWFDFWVAFRTDDLPAPIETRINGEIAIFYQVDLEEVEAPDEDFST
jgi:uncharacterized protein (TIGR02217 family)